jgi:hypothetical protein
MIGGHFRGETLPPQCHEALQTVYLEQEMFNLTNLQLFRQLCHAAKITQIVSFLDGI